MKLENVRRRDCLRASAALTMASMAGCLGGGDEDEETVFWHGTDYWDEEHREWIQERVSDQEIEVSFSEQRYPDLHQQYLTAASNGTPDLIEGIPAMRGDFVNSEIAEPLTSRLEEENFFDGYTDVALESVTHNDEIWAFPYTGNGRGMIYREDIFEEYGWDEFPEDWDEWLEVGSEIAAGEDDLNAFIITTERGNTRAFQEFLSLLYQRIDDIFVEEDGEWVLEASAEDLGIVFEKYFWAPFHATDPPLIDPNTRGIDSLEADVYYWNDNCAVRQAGSFMAASVQDAGEGAEELLSTTSVAHNPLIEGGERDTFAEVKPVFINPHSDDVDDAYEVAKAAVGPEGIQYHHDRNPGNVPPHEDVEWAGPDEVIPAWETFEEILQSGTVPGFWQLSAPESHFHETMQDVIYDDIDPMRAGEELYENWEGLDF